MCLAELHRSFVSVILNVVLAPVFGRTQSVEAAKDVAHKRLGAESHHFGQSREVAVDPNRNKGREGLANYELCIARHCLR